MEQSYNDRINDVLKEIQGGQHLRFIVKLYRTKEVCLEAVKYEAGHNDYMLHDIYSVPMGNLDYVMDKMREFKKDDSYYLKQLEEAYIKRKHQENQSGYYGDFENYQSMLDHYGAVDYDDMIRKQYCDLYSEIQNAKKNVSDTR